jgi:hypothetical protein
MRWYELRPGSEKTPVTSSCEHGNEILGNSQVAERMVPSQEGLSSMDNH